ncbi:MAG TPA: hypothetical protein VFH56_06095, partial [Acidimicrobiales bacterium]|nr:hypothetical protein [Acidimicrobiales bacterium]
MAFPDTQLALPYFSPGYQTAPGFDSQIAGPLNSLAVRVGAYAQWTVTTAGQSIGQSPATTTISGSNLNVDFDPLGWVTKSSGKITVSAAGIYTITGSLAANNCNGARLDAYAYVNGSAVMRNNTATANSNGGAPTNEAVVTLPVKRFHLNSGDAVTLVAFTG